MNRKTVEEFVEQAGGHIASERRLDIDAVLSRLQSSKGNDQYTFTAKDYASLRKLGRGTLDIVTNVALLKIGLMALVGETQVRVERPDQKDRLEQGVAVVETEDGTTSTWDLPTKTVQVVDEMRGQRDTHFFNPTTQPQDDFPHVDVSSDLDVVAWGVWDPSSAGLAAAFAELEKEDWRVTDVFVPKGSAKAFKTALGGREIVDSHGEEHGRVWGAEIRTDERLGENCVRVSSSETGGEGVKDVILWEAKR